MKRVVRSRSSVSLPSGISPLSGVLPGSSFSFLALFLVLTLSFQTGYANQSAKQKFVDRLVKIHAFDEKWLSDYLARAETKESILEAMRRPAEKVLEWKDYQKIFLTDNRIKLGKEFLKKYKKTFDRAERETGVPREIVAAIIGVETRYGKNRGSYRVLDALSTLAFDYPPRSKFFTSELEHYFLLVREQGFDPAALKGSYAGAMGYGQFIPSSYRHYAIDFDGDGVVDILDNPVDAIGSVANYFRQHKWKKGAPIAEAARVTGQQFTKLLHKKLKPRHKVADMRKHGVQVSSKLDSKEPARLMKLVGKSGDEFWVGLHNFYVITRYNHSEMYALAVYQLSQKLSQEP
ncbi:MAG: lytic murein transglycosylase B [Proteobacteria bacterium]|nr:MAG: lytic murein transglycosylase B [Pseudomonadota bacterium]